MLCGLAILLGCALNWEAAQEIPLPTLYLLGITSFKEIVSGTLHAVVPPSAPLSILFGVHFVDIVAIVVAETMTGMAFLDPTQWTVQITLGVICSIIVGLCEIPLWPLKLMRPPGKEHFAIRIRYIIIALLALEVCA